MKKAPEWMIQLITNGKPVKCHVGDKPDSLVYQDTIVGFNVQLEFPYLSMRTGLSYRHAVPLENK